MRPIRAVWRWIVDRTGLDSVWEMVGKHLVPAETGSRGAGWLYVLGFVTLAMFMLQVVTGAVLATKYIPSPAHAYDSLRFINEDVPFGGLLRGLHFFGASAMVAFMLLHAGRVFLTGSYKFPREVNWLTGVLLLVLVMAMAFTGQLLRWNQDGLWGVVVASQYAGRVPLIGDAFREFVLAGQAVGGATLSRFFALHVIWFPLMIFALIGVHLYLVVHHGISEPPEPGRRVDQATYREDYRRRLEREGVPYWPHAAWQELVAAAVVVFGVFVMAVLLGARSLGVPPDPTVVPAHPRPDWFLMWYYALLAVKPRGWEDFTMVYLPILALLFLLLLPLVAGRGERSPSRRPWAVGGLAVVTVTLGTLTGLGYRASWVPDFHTQPIPVEAFAAGEEEIADGSQIFWRRGCQHCHAVLGRGGEYGPDLTRVLTRLSPEAVSAVILGGRGDMPAYRDILEPRELELIMAFMRWLEARPSGAGERLPEHFRADEPEARP